MILLVYTNKINWDQEGEPALAMAVSLYAFLDTVIQNQDFLIPVFYFLQNVRHFVSFDRKCVYNVIEGSD